MFVTPYLSNDPFIKRIISFAAGEATGPTEVRKGVYDGVGFNFRNMLNLSRLRDYDLEDPRLVDKDGEFFGSYGVCDSIEQMLERCPMLETSDRKFAVGFTLVRKADQSPQGGWRWHKWGEYIGTQEPKCEYLYDEPVIEQAYCYNVIEFTDGEYNDR